MRYLTLAEALTIAEAVTGTNAAILAKATRLELLESALHTAQAGFGDVEFYPSSSTKVQFWWCESRRIIRSPMRPHANAPCRGQCA